MSIAPHVLVEAPLEGHAVGGRVAVAEGTLHHLTRVLRLGDGAALSLTDGRGTRADGALHEGDVVLTSGPERAPERAPRLVLAQALAKGRRAEDAVRVACELGVDRIVPVVAARTQGRPDARAAQALRDRWRAVAVAALEQSRGTVLASVEEVVDGVVAAAPAQRGVLRIIAVPGAVELPRVLTAAAADADVVGEVPDEVVVAVGPEGGWTAQEHAAAVAAGWTAAGLGPTVLRTEHAGPVAMAVVAATLGRWGGGRAGAVRPGTEGAAPLRSARPPSRSPDAL